MTEAKLVPVEPTEAMTMAGAGCLPSVDGVFGLAGALSANVYRAMLSAAPEPVSDPYKLVMPDNAMKMRMAHNLSDGFGPEFVSQNEAFAMAVIQEFIDAQPLSNTQELVSVACQKCGGEVQAWTCQGCGATFTENASGRLVFNPEQAAPVVGEPVAWLYERKGFGTAVSLCEQANDLLISQVPLYAHPDPKLDVAVKALDDLITYCRQQGLYGPEMADADQALAQIKGGA